MMEHFSSIPTSYIVFFRECLASVFGLHKLGLCVVDYSVKCPLCMHTCRVLNMLQPRMGCFNNVLNKFMDKFV